MSQRTNLTIIFSQYTYLHFNLVQLSCLGSSIGIVYIGVRINHIGVDCASVDEYMDPPHIYKCTSWQGETKCSSVSLPAPSTGAEEAPF